jgi:oxalate decarboxylase
MWSRIEAGLILVEVEVRIVDSHNFKASTTSAAIVTVRPDDILELHWHPNADEWQCFISVKGLMTVFATGGRVRTMNFQAGDVGYIEKMLPHYIENAGDSDLKLLEMFSASTNQDLALSEWLTHPPPELVLARMKIDRATLHGIPHEEVVITPE